ncbi:hypothetical protein TKK_0014019 [Trichogramma kaykai]
MSDMSLHRSEDQIIIPSDDDDEDDFFQLRSVALTYKSVKLLSCQEICPQIPQEFFDAMPVKEVFIMRYYFQLTHESIEACFAQFQLEDWSYFNLNGEPRIILYSNQLCSLKSNEYVNGALIDAYMTVKIAQKKSKNISFLPTTLTISILGRNRDNPKNSSFNGFKLNHTIEGLIFMPYCLGSHWSLLVADVAKKELTEYDPLDDDDDDDDDEQESCPKSSKAAIYFMRYLNRYNLCAPDNTWNVTKIQWTIASPNIPKRPVQKDDYNCGIFVIHYMNLLAGDISLSSFNPDEFRVKLALYLLENSENVQDICLRCEKQEDLVYECGNCHRRMHDKCAVNFCFLSDKGLCIFCNNLEIKNYKIGFPNPKGTNSCWLNACLQVLMYISPIDTLHVCSENNTSSIIRHLQKLSKHLNSTQRGNGIRTILS